MGNFSSTSTARSFHAQQVPVRTTPGLSSEESQLELVPFSCSQEPTSRVRFLGSTARLCKGWP